MCRRPGAVARAGAGDDVRHDTSRRAHAANKHNVDATCAFNSGAGLRSDNTKRQQPKDMALRYSGIPNDLTRLTRTIDGGWLATCGASRHSRSTHADSGRVP